MADRQNRSEEPSLCKSCAIASATPPVSKSGRECSRQRSGRARHSQGLTFGVLQALTACAHRGCVAARDLGSEEIITRPVPGTLGSKLVRLMGSYKGGNLEIRTPKSNVSF